MEALVTLAVLFCVIIPAAAWVFNLTFRIMGWTLRMIFGVLLFPLWIVLALAGGIALAAQVLIPIAVVFFVGSLIFSD